MCTGQRQSPVDIPTRGQNNSCEEDEETNELEWATENNTEVSWVVKNTGRMGKLHSVLPLHELYIVLIKFNKYHFLVKIEIQPEKSLYTLFRVNETHQVKHYVDYMQLKWGSNSSDGSEHSINGVRHAGEVRRLK